MLGALKKIHSRLACVDNCYAASREHQAGAQFTFCTGTKVQILTQKRYAALAAGVMLCVVPMLSLLYWYTSTNTDADVLCCSSCRRFAVCGDEFLHRRYADQVLATRPELALAIARPHDH